MSPLRLTLPVTLLLISTGFSKDYLPPGGGWDYLFEGDAAAGSAGAALDGSWNHNSNSDHWDGTAPGSGNPGGITVVPVSGEPGNSALLMVDAVTASGTNNNRRFALIHDLSANEGIPATFLDDGATLAFRLRLPGSAPDLPSAPDGLNPHSGSKGMVNLRSNAGRISFALGIAGTDSSYQQDGMLISDANATFFHALDPTAWNEFWVTTEQNSADASLYDLRVYRNGSIVPVIVRSIKPSTTVDASYPYISLQLSATNQKAAVEIDYIAFKDGLHLPNDSDNDALPDTWELIHFPDLGQSGDDDAEPDGLTNNQEFNLGTDPNLADSDGDGLNDAAEFNQHGSDPALADSDGDGLDDGAEINGVPATNPLVADSDGDELSDGEEVLTHGTDPTNADSDGDGYKDGIEVAFGYDPNDAGSTPTVQTLDNLLINEFMADNDGARLDSDGESSDWIELWNPTSSPVNLAGHYLTDNQQVPNNWALPPIIMQPGSYLLVFASGKDRNAANSELHTNFKLTSGGEYLALTRDDGAEGFTVLSEYAATYPKQQQGISYGLNPDSLEHGYLRVPSPGRANGETFKGFVGDTAFNVDRGFFDAAFDLEITSSTEGAIIRYTTDGSTPSATSGQIYAGAIRITGTTVVRAIAYSVGYEPTNVDTQTYLFAEDVVDQSRMRTSVTQSASLGPQMIDALKSVPTISIVTDNPAPFMNEGGSNIRSESPASVEMIFPDGTPGFQENGGLKHFGGYYTNFPKKSFRIGFRSQYGATKINYPLFEGFDYKHYPPTDRFDVMDLRSGSHDMNSRGAYMSNRFTDDSMLDMGNLAPHGRFVHVYLNGNYWGQYHLRERWNANMASSYFGGPKTDYDAVNLNDNFRNDEKVYDGTGVFWNEAKALASGPNPWANNDNNIDVANLIDFMLLWVSGNSESEVRLLGSKAQGQPFRFQMKDADGFLRSTGRSVTHPGPLDLMSRLRSGNTDFAMLLADRIHKHFFNDGALTPAKNIERLQKRVDEARPGFIAESARWGNRFREYQNWLSYQQNLVNNHFPGLSQTMIARFRSAGMYPDIIAPVFSQHGGSIAPGAGITMTTDSTAIYYTLDGSDPRLSGGAVNPLATAAQFAGDAPSPQDFITTGHVWKYLDDGSDQGIDWRATNFDDSGWADGPSELGYAEGDEATRVAFIDTDPLAGGTQRNATTYFRADVELSDPAAYSYFIIKLKYDDGAAVYANGMEILRTTNLPANAAFNTFANRSTPNEHLFFNFQIPSSRFVDGMNSLAVEIHNASPSSSDISFDMVLRGEIDTSDGDNVTKPVIMTEPATLRARTRNVTTGQWSALNEAFFSIGAVPATASNLVISEIHYHPGEPSSPEEIATSSDRDDYEFVEFLNTGNNPIDLTQVYFTDGITFTFPLNTILNPGKRLVIVRNLEAFTSRYGEDEAIYIAGEYSGRLSNDGEHLALFSDATGDILEFTYNDQVPWPTLADGAGHSLVAINTVPAEGENWGAHALVGGAPGYPDDIISSGYLAWKNANNINSDLGDADEDGIPNLAEYGFGTNPRSTNAAALPSTSTITLEDESYLTITYQKNLAADDARVYVQSSADLSNWKNDETLITVSEIVHPDKGYVIVTRRTAKPVTAHNDTYLRVVVTL
jgi:hypothetical protein